MSVRALVGGAAASGDLCGISGRRCLCTLELAGSPLPLTTVGSGSLADAKGMSYAVSKSAPHWHTASWLSFRLL